MTISVLDLKLQYDSIKSEIDGAISGVINNSSFVLGPVVGQFEEHVATYCDCNHGIGVASGTDALLLSLMAAGIAPGDEVITTPFTFVATGNTISRCGATPIFVDVEPDTLNIDVSQIADAVTERTKAIIPVHLFGHPVDMSPLMQIAETYGLKVIEDAAQAIGARYQNQSIGSFGLAGCLSFYPTKNLGAYGDAGMVITNDAGISERIDLLRRQGSKRKYFAEILGLNSRLDGIQAAILDVKLRYLDGWNTKRRALATRYNELLAGLPVTTPVEKPYAHHVYHQYTIQTDRRDALAKALKKKDIGTMIYYPVPLNQQPLYAGDVPICLPVAERAATRVLSLPMYPELTSDQQERVVEAIRDFFAGR